MGSLPHPVGSGTQPLGTQTVGPGGPIVRVGLTLLGRADEVPDTTNTAIILALRFVQLHAHPLATGKLRSPAEPQCARLRKQGRIWFREAMIYHWHTGIVVR